MHITAENIIEHLEPTYWEKQGMNLSLIKKLFNLCSYELLYTQIILQNEVEAPPKKYLETNTPNNIYDFSNKLPSTILLNEYEDDLINLLQNVISSFQNPSSESGQPLDFNTYIQYCESGYKSFNTRFYATGLFDPFHDESNEDFEAFFKKKN